MFTIEDLSRMRHSYSNNT